MSLPTKIYITITILFLLLSASIGYIFYSRWSENIYSIVKDQQKETARQTFEKIDSILYERLMDIQEIASEEQTIQLVLGNRKKAKEALVREISDLSRSTGPWESIRYIRADGEVVASMDQSEIGTQFEEEDVILSVFEKAMQGETIYSDVVKKHNGAHTIVFAYPIKQIDIIGKPVIGVAIGQYSWTVVQEIISNVGLWGVNLLTSSGEEIASNHEIPSKTELYTDYSSNPMFLQAKIKGSGTLVFPNLESGEPSLATYLREPGYRTFRGNDWIIFFQTPLSTIQSSIMKTIVPVGVIFFILILFVNASMLFVLRTVLFSPLNSLVKTVRSISAGKLDERSSISSTNEVGMLARAINDMAHSLSLSNAELEKKISERTTALEASQKTMEEKVKELETMNKLMVGRELRMIEIKRELENLKKKA